MLLASSTPPPPATLCWGKETIVFSFVTSQGKTACLCEGTKQAYLVYRYGKPAKIELQYPTVLDTSSWERFTYFSYFRGGGAANEGHEDYSLTFRNGGAEYELYEQIKAVSDGVGVEPYLREVGINVSTKSKSLSIVGNESTSRGSLRLTEEERMLVMYRD